MTITIYHNPACGTSRAVLAAIRATGQEPEVVEYLKLGWSKPQLQALFAAAGVTAHEALRRANSPAAGMGLTAEGVTADQILDAMVQLPGLVQRPFVVTPKGSALCRPADRLAALL
ncbi:arsenate reductase family protein [Tabrizicola oligotrophica]|uniref:Arsenate reductase n=1 Tax=Tabrizicola oligotrophica TaxID=2710650 RepID=A0A6M0QV71_9RHOB|nr:arsenate reductase family protein [Tabrizicola oligotrophica]NEY91307.1 arsenate reductase family protein [Tabrizicola oligotrophica]